MAKIRVLERLQQRLQQAAGVLDDIEQAKLVKSAEGLLKALDEAVELHEKRTKEKEQPR